MDALPDDVLASILRASNRGALTALTASARRLRAAGDANALIVLRAFDLAPRTSQAVPVPANGIKPKFFPNTEAFQARFAAVCAAVNGEEAQPPRRPYQPSWAAPRGCQPSWSLT